MSANTSGLTSQLRARPYRVILRDNEGAELEVLIVAATREEADKAGQWWRASGAGTYEIVKASA